MEWEPWGRREGVVLLYRELNQGGQPKDTTLVKDLLNEVVSLSCPPRLSFNRDGCSAQPLLTEAGCRPACF